MEKTVSTESLTGSSTVNNESSSLLKRDSGELDNRSLFIGVGFALLFAVSTTLSIPCLQLLGAHTVQPMELLFYGFLAHLLTSVPVWGVCWGRLKKLEPDQAKWFTVAALCNGMSTSLFYMSAETLPSGVVGALGQGSLLLLSIIITVALDRHISKALMAATAVCVVGLVLYLISVTYYDPVVVIPLPSVNISHDPLLIGTQKRNVLTSFHPSMSYILLVLSSLLYIGANFIMHRKLSQASFSKVLLFFPVVGFLVATILLFLLTTPVWTLDLSAPRHLLPFIGFIVLFDICGVSLYASWMRTPPPVFSLIAAGSIALLVLLQYVIKVPEIQSGHPDALEIIGAILILVANAIGAIGELDFKTCVRQG
ncbi:hypothetical protein CAPTEDRAFT_220425 [Capitella teleta]|uniref:EamA domain-containing protein n=1 Tax=Capitella teleta TaxID=283909 RepID=R7VBN4_CAPTE|nr:hypothetical protein CAPTEDRAFT_220425 [Capitella teleta]|eukprot:ELU13696.1 hypothetical protein CAPTEDRAFT_220425 [Capitella teleta]